jgi:hypothetical protein
MLAARLALSSTVLAAALAIGGFASLAHDALLQPATQPSALLEPRRARPHIVGRLLDVGGEPFVGGFTLSTSFDFPDSSSTSLNVWASTDATGAFDFELRAPRVHRPGTDLTWSIAPDDAAPSVDFVLAGKDARRSVGTLTFESGADGAVIGDIGIAQLLEPPRVASLRIDGPVATTHAVVLDESDFGPSKYGPFDYPHTEPFSVATGSTIELFSWSTATRWRVFTDPASPRAEALTAVVERGNDLVLTSRELLRVCVTIDLPPPTVDARSARLVVQPITAAVTPSAIVVDPTRDPAREWIVNFEVPARHGATIHRLLLSSHEFELYLHAGIHRIEYWRREHVSDGPLRAATAPVFVERDVELR